MGDSGESDTNLFVFFNKDETLKTCFYTDEKNSGTKEIYDFGKTVGQLETSWWHDLICIV